MGLTKEEIIDLPDGIIGVERTNSASDLAAFYSSAVALVNTTYTDTCPTVNMESLACGTPVITYRTGGSPELVVEGVTGWVVEKGDKSAMVESILKVINSTTCLSSNCTQYAIEHFDSKKCFILILICITLFSSYECIYIPVDFDSIYFCLYWI